MSLSLTDYADRVWHGAVDDSIVHAGQAGSGVIEVVDGVGWHPGFGNVVTFRTDDQVILFDTGNPLSAAVSTRPCAPGHRSR